MMRYDIITQFFVDISYFLFGWVEIYEVGGFILLMALSVALLIIVKDTGIPWLRYPASATMLFLFFPIIMYSINIPLQTEWSAFGYELTGIPDLYGIF